jgi:hypothetical protein
MKKILYNLATLVSQDLVWDYERWKFYKRLIPKFRTWQKNGYPVPPPHLVKQLAISEYCRQSKVTTLIETGTFLGYMMEAQKDNFQKLISIELDEKLYQRAKRRFAKYPQIEILKGDSGKLMPEVVARLKEPALFWLDGHYSAEFTAKGDLETPIIQELESIFKSPIDHVILIDDARDFKGENDYPTLESLKKYVLGKKPNYNFSVKDDIIRIHLGQ